MSLERHNMNKLTIISTEQNKQQSQINETYKIKKEILQKHYEQKYKKDVKSHKTQQTVGIVSTIILAITAYASKWKNQELNIGTFAFGAASLIWPLFKPKKEKYEAAMQKELNEVV